MQIIPRLFNLCRVRIFDQADAVTALSACPDLSVQFTMIGGQHESDGPNVIATNCSVGLREIYWRVCVTCYVLACVSPKTIGAYLWKHVPAVNSLMLMSVSDRFFYPPAYADAEGIMLKRLGGDSSELRLPVSLERFGDMVTQAVVGGDDLATGQVDVASLSRRAREVFAVARSLEGAYDIDHFIRSLERCVWDALFRPRLKEPSLAERVPKRVRTDVDSKGDYSGALTQKRARSSVLPSSCFPWEGSGRSRVSAQVQVPSPGVDGARRSSRHRVSRFDVKALLAAAGDTDDETSGSDAEDVQEARRKHSRPLSKPLIRSRPAAAAAEMYLQSVTRWGIPNSEDIVFLPLQSLCRAPPLSVIKAVKQWNNKFQFGTLLRQCVDPDFIADVAGGQRITNDDTQADGVVQLSAHSGRADVLESIGWLVPAIVADIQDILCRVPLVACTHILLVTLLQVVQKMSQYGVHRLDHITAILQHTNVDALNQSPPAALLHTLAGDDSTRRRQLRDLLLSTAHLQDVILCRGLVDKLQGLLVRHQQCSEHEVLQMRQLLALPSRDRGIEDVGVNDSDFCVVMAALLMELSHSTSTRRSVARVTLHLLHDALTMTTTTYDDFDISAFFALFSSEGGALPSSCGGISEMFREVMRAVVAVETDLTLLHALWGRVVGTQGGAFWEGAGESVASQIVLSLSLVALSPDDSNTVEGILTTLLGVLEEGQQRRRQFGWMLVQGDTPSYTLPPERYVPWGDMRLLVDAVVLCGRASCFLAASKADTWNGSDAVMKSWELFCSIVNSLSFHEVENKFLEPFLQLGKTQSYYTCEALARGVALDLLSTLVLKYDFPLPFVVAVLNRVETETEDVDAVLSDPSDNIRDLLRMAAVLSPGDDLLLGLPCVNRWRRLLSSQPETAEGLSDSEDAVTVAMSLGPLSQPVVEVCQCGGEEGGHEGERHSQVQLDDLLLCLRSRDAEGAVRVMNLLLAGYVGHIDRDGANSSDDDKCTAVTQVLGDILRRVACSCSRVECMLGVDAIMGSLLSSISSRSSLFVEIVCRVALQAPCKLSSKLADITPSAVQAVQGKLSQMVFRLEESLRWATSDDLMSSWRGMLAAALPILRSEDYSGHVWPLVVSVLYDALDRVWLGIRGSVWRAGWGLTDALPQQQQCSLSEGFMGDLAVFLAHTNHDDLPATCHTTMIQQRTEAIVSAICRILSIGMLGNHHSGVNEHV